ncbi:AlbA family DNA-binding domain-containing protein, partial [Methylobacterium dankookense]
MTQRRILEAPIGDLTFADIEGLIRDEAEEGPRLELKRELPANDRQGDPWMRGGRSFANPARDGLAKEVVALANAYGGVIVVGIDETEDCPSSD